MKHFHMCVCIGFVFMSACSRIQTELDATVTPIVSTTRASEMATQTATPYWAPSTRPLPTVVAGDLGFSRSSPVPLGKALPWSSLLIGVTDVIWPANDVILAASPYNATPQSGSQYLLVGLSVECRVGDDDMCVFFREDAFQVIDEGGETYNNFSDLVGIPTPFEPSDLEGGDTIEGYLVFMVPSTSRDLVLIYWKYFSGETYFALE